MLMILLCLVLGDVLPDTIEKMETHDAYIETSEDAIKLFEAC
jgi:hypothetical protein